MPEAITAKIDLQGAKELDKSLTALGNKVARKIAIKSLRVGAKIIQTQAKANAPVKTGLVRRSIVVRSARKRKGESAAVAVRTSEGKGSGKAFYATFIDKGWMQAPHYRLASGQIYSFSKKAAQRLGFQGHHIEGTQFMERAINSKASQAANAVVESMRENIEAAAGKT